MTANRDPLDHGLPDWVSDALRRPVDSRAETRALIMDRINRMPAPRRHSAPMRPSRWLRRGWLSPAGGFLTTTVLALIVVLRAGVASGIPDVVTATRVLGDTVVPTRSAMTDEHWLDTLRIVEFVIRGTSVHAAAVLGDFNQWRRGATPLVETSPHEWRARVLVPRDALNVAYLVNGARLIPVSRLTRPD